MYAGERLEGQEQIHAGASDRAKNSYGLQRHAVEVADRKSLTESLHEWLGSEALGGAVLPELPTMHLGLVHCEPCFTSCISSINNKFRWVHNNIILHKFYTCQRINFTSRYRCFLVTSKLHTSDSKRVQISAVLSFWLKNWKIFSFN